MLVKIEAYHDGDLWCARGISEGIFTQGDTFEHLMDKVKDALALHFEEELDQGETLQVLILVETEVTGKLNLEKSIGGDSAVPIKEIQRRKKLVGRILKRRDELPPLGMTTAELVRLAREESKWLYEA
jgi:hypothetical protein